MEKFVYAGWDGWNIYFMVIENGQGARAGQMKLIHRSLLPAVSTWIYVFEPFDE